MEFSEFRQLLANHIDTMLEHNLYTVDVDKETLWNTYLDSFPPGTNEIFRERREFDCSCCRQFIKSFGRTVAIDKNYNIISIWDFKTGEDKFQPVVDALSSLTKSHSITDIFATHERIFGTDKNYEKFDDQVITWEHFYYKLPKSMTTTAPIGPLLGKYRESKNVFKRSLEELTIDSVETVLDLIKQKSLYKGEEWKGVLTSFLNLQKEYESIDAKDVFCWQNSVNSGPAISRIRNHSIGVLLQDISNGIDLDEAVKRYEKIVAPSNYKRPKAIFTKKMIEQAEKTVKELGLLPSLPRRHATVEDITVNNILFANKDTTKKMNETIFDSLKQSTPVKKFKQLSEISVEDFISDVLPGCTNIELLLENKHISNLVSLIAPQNPDSPTLFKWNNNFSWAYNGNITDSMKERVKAAGGNVEGVLRFSIQWNDENDNNNDFDAHCIEPNGNEIFYSNKRTVHPSSGMLDVDIQRPKHERPGEPSVENITWTDFSKMREGVYYLFVHNYSHHGGRSGFSAEIEYDGQIYSFEYPKELKQHEKVIVAKIKLNKEKGIEFISSLSSTTASKDIWNIQTNQFHPVSVLMFSPNYWDSQKGIGHKHYFFMLKDCINSDQPNGFFNEFLKEGLLKHKRVFEALGSKMRVEYSENQLSGVGFSSTKRNSVTCRVEGSFTRILKINF